MADDDVDSYFLPGGILDPAPADSTSMLDDFGIESGFGLWPRGGVSRVVDYPSALQPSDPPPMSGKPRTELSRL